MPVEKVTTYKTSDGSLFEDAVKAREHERETAAHNAIMEFAESVVFPGMDAGDLAEALEERGHEIKIDAYNLLYDLPRAAVGKAFIVHCSSVAGPLKFRFVTTDPDNEETNDRLVDSYIETLRYGGIPDIALEGVYPESDNGMATVVGLATLE